MRYCDLLLCGSIRLLIYNLVLEETIDTKPCAIIMLEHPKAYNKWMQTEM